MATIKGTSKADKLSSAKPGTDIYGYGGDDVLSGLAGGIRLYGGDGRDELTAKFASKSPAKASFLYGGNGNDVITAAISAKGGLLKADFYGGDGHDRITVSATSQIHDTEEAKFSRVFVGGGAGNDKIAATARTVGGEFLGPDSDLIIDAGSGDDIVKGLSDSSYGYAKSTVWGGAGNDVLDIETSSGAVYVSNSTVKIYGGDGNDTITSTEWSSADVATSTSLIDGGTGNDKISVTMDTLYDIMVDLTVTGGSGDDVISARIKYGWVREYWAARLYGGSGDDKITARVESSDPDAYARIYGGDGDDSIRLSGGGASSLYGGSGDDTITGGRGNDTITGGSGADQLYGGFGEDTFVYLEASGETAATRDTISDFETGDIIDLSAIDADTTVAGDQAFTWGGYSADVGSLNFHLGDDGVGYLFAKTGAGQLRIDFEEPWSVNLTAESFIL